MSAQVTTLRGSTVDSSRLEKGQSSGANQQALVLYNDKSYPPALAKYEEVVKDPEIFWTTLESFHLSLGKQLEVPKPGGEDLDLLRLFVEVTSRGGIQKVVRDRRWKEVVIAYNFPLCPTIPSPSFYLRHHYMSLLYHYEQVYYFRKEAPATAIPDRVSGSTINEPNLEEGLFGNPLEVGQSVQLGSSVFGTIRGKCDAGYIVSVEVGSEQLRGMMCHLPEEKHVSQSSERVVSPTPTSTSHQKRSRAASKDPSKPKSNRSGYNFFFGEHYPRLKHLYNGQVREVSKVIAQLWNNLSEGEKQVYLDRAVQDKERYRVEMLEYKNSHD